MAEKTIQERLRKFGKLELAISGKPWTLGEDAATELDVLTAQLAEMRRQRDDALTRVARLEAELRAVLGDAPYIFSKRVDSIVAALAATEPKP